MRERCGVVAAATKGNVVETIYLALIALQHRGQEAAGIAAYDKNREGINSIKGLGLVSEAFKEGELADLKGKKGIGHTYYSQQISSPANAQPTIVHTSSGDIGIAHNGIITNAHELKKKLMEKGHTYYQGSEEESIAFLLADFLKETNFEKAVKNMMRELQGSYCLTLLLNDQAFGVRDPLGIRPLCLGKSNDGYVIASESVALDVVGAELINDVQPGELVEVTRDGYTSHLLMDEKYKAHCFFEHVYFSRADSVIEERDVYMTRKKIGEILAREHPTNADIVVPVPDSGRTHAYGFSSASGIPLVEGLMKNRYIARTFIMPEQEVRERKVRLKINPVKAVIKGKRVILIDDSIVRGTTMRQIVDVLRLYGAKEIHVRIGSPPIIAPCYFGIDMSTREQLIASEKRIDEICKSIHADSLGYTPIDGIIEALRIKKENLCLGCVTGEYPISIPNEKHRFQKNLEKWA